MNHTNEDFGGEWIEDAGGEAGFPDAEDFSEPESSALTWDEETVRVTHREVSLRARRASSDRIY